MGNVTSEYAVPKIFSPGTHTAHDPFQKMLSPEKNVQVCAHFFITYLPIERFLVCHCKFFKLQNKVYF